MYDSLNIYHPNISHLEYIEDSCMSLPRCPKASYAFSYNFLKKRGGSFFNRKYQAKSQLTFYNIPKTDSNFKETQEPGLNNHLYRDFVMVVSFL